MNADNEIMDAFIKEVKKMVNAIISEKDRTVSIFFYPDSGCSVSIFPVAGNRESEDG